MAQTLVFTAPPRTWIRIAGPDAQDFLHRLTTANVRALPVGGGAPSCLLNPQGRILSAFTLWRTGESEFGLDVDTHLKDETLGVIDRYTFAEKMTIEPSTELSPAWALPSQGESDSQRQCTQEEAVRVCRNGTNDFGRPWLTIWGPREKNEAWIQSHFPDALPAQEAELERLRVLALSPRAGHELTSDVNPLEIGLRAAVADNKGCYPGQEVLEKIIAIGAPARRLALIEISGAPAVPTQLLDESGRECGTLTSIAPPDRGLALLRKTHAAIGTSLHTTEGLQAHVLEIARYE